MRSGTSRRRGLFYFAFSLSGSLAHETRPSEFESQHLEKEDSHEDGEVPVECRTREAAPVCLSVRLKFV